MGTVPPFSTWCVLSPVSDIYNYYISQGKLTVDNLQANIPFHPASYQLCHQLSTWVLTSRIPRDLSVLHNLCTNILN